MRLNFKSYGSGEPLVILHGLFGSLNNWNTLSRKLGERFHVYALDQRNHGAAPHSSVHTYEAMAEDLREFLEEHQLGRVHLLGHSMGGKTAMEFALAHPQAVTSLTVVDIAPVQYPSRHDDILDALSSLDLDAFASRQQVDVALARKLPDKGVRQFLLTNLRLGEGNRYSWRMNFDALKKSYPELSRGLKGGRKFDGPALFIRGGKSTYIQEKDIPAIQSLFPRAQIQTIPGIGHWVHAEAPEEFLRIVIDFLSRNSDANR